jgi:hypothetical protein
MEELTAREIMAVLFSQRSSDTDRISVLVDLVFDLMTEVQALREGRIRGGQDLDSYREPYQDTAWLSHNASGPTDGWHKLLHHFYPEQKRAARVWRESLMLGRLGLTDDEIAQFEPKAEQSERYT